MKLLVWVFIVGCLIGAIQSGSGGWFVVALILFLVGPGVAIPAVIAARGKTVESSKSIAEIQQIAAATFAEKKTASKWTRVSQGYGQLNYEMMSTKAGCEPTVSIDIVDNGSGSKLVHVWMSAWTSGGLNGGKGTPFWVWGGSRANSKVNAVAAALGAPVQGSISPAPQGSTSLSPQVSAPNGLGTSASTVPATAPRPAPKPKLTLSEPMVSFVKLIRDNGLGFSVEGTNPDKPTYRGDKVPYVAIETTQLFSDSSCPMTNGCKEWQENPFHSGELGNIDLGILSPFSVCASACLPTGSITDERDRQRSIQQMESLIREDDKFNGRAQCGSYANTPYLMVTTEFDEPALRTAQSVFSFLQLFALEVHRIFGGLVKPSEVLAESLKSSTPQPVGTNAHPGKVLSEAEVMQVILKYQTNDPSITRPDPRQIILSFPEGSTVASEDRYSRLAEAFGDGIIGNSINKYLPLVVFANGANGPHTLSAMHESTNTEYSQTSGGGIILCKLSFADEDNEMAEILREEDLAILMVCNFLNLSPAELEKDQVFIDIGLELARGFAADGIGEAEVEVYKFINGEQVHIY